MQKHGSRVPVALRLSIASALLAFGIAGVGTPASAAIVIAAAPPAINHAFHCAVQHWTWGLAAAAEASPGDNCTDWNFAPSSPAAAGAKTLLFGFEHTNAHFGEANPNPAAPEVVNAGQYVAGFRRAGVVAIDHAPHRDVYKWKVIVPPAAPPGAPPAGPATIEASAAHYNMAVIDKEKPKWSYTNESGEKVTINSVTASYKIAPDKRVKDGDFLPGVKLDPGRDREGPLPRGADNEAPSDYHIRVTIGDPYFSDMTLAFVIGQPGSFELGELGLMNQVFVGAEEYFVPMIFDNAGLQDLYIAVDLTQWLSFPIEFMGGDIFSFVDGFNASLAGITVATSPFTFDSTLGSFVSSDLWTGTGIAFGRVDGGNIPEPATLTLIATGMLGLVGLRKRRRQ